MELRKYRVTFYASIEDYGGKILGSEIYEAPDFDEVLTLVVDDVIEKDRILLKIDEVLE